MTETITLTKEMLLAAKSYIPNAEKEMWVADTAAKCFDRLSIAVDGDPVPDMYIINTGLKYRYLMTALVSKYFGMEYEADEKDTALMSEADYDRWASGHVFCEIDRWKRDKDVVDKCFDLLYDYHDLEKRFSSQIASLLGVQNDPVMRQAQYGVAQLKELPKLLTQLRELQEANESMQN